jgi:RHS repeat-associated protein
MFKRILITYTLLVFTLLNVSVAYAEDSDGPDTSTSAPEGSSSALSSTGSEMFGAGGTNAGGGMLQADEFTGAATYSFPIPVPPSRGGIEPQLVLNYNSFRRNPNSWVGYGWDLELGMIERLPGDDNTISFGSSDGFQARFAGQTESLVYVEDSSDPASDYGVSLGSGCDDGVEHVKEYRAKVEGAYNIYLRFICNQEVDGEITDSYEITFDVGWIVIDKGGRYYYFGQSDSSRIQGSGDAPNVGAWLLDSVVDPNENELTITYDENHYLEEVAYQDITIEFHLEDKSTVFPQFKQMFLEIENVEWRLDQIEIKQDGSRLQLYDFEFQNTDVNRFQLLERITPYGETEYEYLPSIDFEYNEEVQEGDNLWLTSEKNWSANKNSSGVSNYGWINNYTQLIDMNADGLVDIVHAEADSDDVYVYYNTGSDFDNNASASIWKDPLGEDPCDQDGDGDDDEWYGCSAKLIGYGVGYSEDDADGGDDDGSEPDIDLPTDGQQQIIFLQDMNGDLLPDRVRTKLDGYDKSFEVFLNTGTKWKTNGDEWEDPCDDEGEGYVNNRVFLMDMNGDGLVDRVCGNSNDPSLDEDRKFQVYLNNGEEFESDGTRWEDPLNEIDQNSAAKGNNTGTYGYGIYAGIRDFNGDGLPDRFNVVTDVSGDANPYYECTGSPGLVVFLNKGGEKWAQPDDECNADGVNILAIRDPSDDDQEGYINFTHDWIDINGDGFLDRVVGDEDDGTFNVYFYQGMKTAGTSKYVQLSDAYEFEDPVDDADSGDCDDEGNDCNASGYIYRTHDVGGRIPGDRGAQHGFIFTIDMNGDGFLDRVVLSDRSASEADRSFEVHLMQINPVEFNDAKSFWVEDDTSQPSLLLNRVRANVVDDVPGFETVIEYLPTTLPLSQTELTHRFLPFNIYTVHKIHQTDYTLPVDEHDGYEGMRSTTFWYTGGNFFMREKDDGYWTKSFNGFQKVEKSVYKAPSETWDEYTTTTIYHQIIGDVDPNVDDVGHFESDAYSHYTLSGKVYKQTITTDDYTVVEEESAYTVNADSGEYYECNGTCLPQLESHTKTIKDSETATERVSSVEYEYYEDYSNIKYETHYDGDGAEVIQKYSYYYDESDFDASLHIRDRPKYQYKRKAGTSYRKKKFEYDSLGNPTNEYYYSTTSDSVEITRDFNSNGTLDNITDVHGITKNLSYDTQGIFPEEEQVSLPSGSTMTTTREYNRMLGKVKKEELDTGVGKETEFDDFGRPSKEYIIDSSGSTTLTKQYQYEYEEVTITSGSASYGIIVQKTSVWQPQPDFSDTNVGSSTPMSVSYSDVSGFALQSCAYSEDGQYRVIQKRIENGGRTQIKTEPFYQSSCSFLSSLGTSVVYKSYKDLQGRVTYQENAGGDTNSPVSNLTFSYDSTSDGYVIKTTTDDNGRSREETFDKQERLIKAVDAGGNELEYEYNPVGDLESVSLNGTQMIVMEYDMLGRKLSMWDLNLGTWTYEYNAEGYLEKQTDNIGNYVSYIYDSLGRVETKSIYDAADILEKTEVYSYDAGDGTHDVLDGELYKVEEYTNGTDLIRTSKFGYDTTYRRITRVTRSIDGIGDFEQNTIHNYLGRVESLSYPGGESLYYSYNRLGGMETMCNTSDCSDEQYYYVDPNSGYSVYGSLLEETYGNGVTGSYEYYPNSHRLYQATIAKDGTNYSQRQYDYDVYANITKLNDTLNSSATSSGNGGFTTIAYDELNRLTSYQSEDSTSAQTYTYDPNGNMLTNSKEYGSSIYNYSTSIPHAVSSIGSTSFSYDNNGNMTDDGDRTMVYNAQNKLTKVTLNTSGMIVGYDYDYTGARVSKKVTREDAYTHVVENTTHYLGDALVIKDDKLIMHIHAGNKKIATKTLGDIDEILAGTGATLKNAGIHPTLRLSMLTPYLLLLIALGLLLSFRPVQSLPSWAYKYICSPSLRRGRPACLPVGEHTGSPLPNFIYRNVFHFLTIILLKYRSFARTFQETIFTLHHRTATKFLCFFLCLLFIIQLPLYHAHAGDTGSVPTSVSDEDYFYYIHGDHLGSSHLMTEGNKESGLHAGITYNNGDLLQRIEYNPFGKEKYVLNPGLKMDPSFTGQKYDVETGLYYYKARYYNPKLGRFTQADTVIPSATDTQAFNRYSYVRNNPVKYTDPTGHSWFKKIAGAFLGALVGVLVTLAVLYSFGVAGGTIAAMFKAASIGELIFAGAVGGAVGGAVSGGISGGIKGAGLGAVFGGLMGGVTAGLGRGLNNLVGSAASKTILASAGAAISYATDGWKGLVTFGANLAGAVVGAGIGKGIFTGRGAKINALANKVGVGGDSGNKFSFDNVVDRIELSSVKVNSNSNIQNSTSLSNSKTPAISIKSNVEVSSQVSASYFDDQRFYMLYAGIGLMGTGFELVQASSLAAALPVPGARVAAGVGIVVGLSVMIIGGITVSESLGFSNILSNYPNIFTGN